MRLRWYKYQALGNDFLVIDSPAARLTRAQWSSLARSACHRRAGVGADGLLRLWRLGASICKVDLFNADGSWAEKSGNGLRIVGLHEHLKNRRRRRFRFDMAGEEHVVTLVKKAAEGFLLKTELGCPEFRAARVPVKARHAHLINAPFKLRGITLTVTCLSIGNPHTVLFVDDFDFDWKALGEEIEHHPAFPQRTNVEFVRVLSRKKLRVADWERGAGATGSSGTGAAAAVCAAVMTGRAVRDCEVVFDTGSLRVNWREQDNVIELTGPAQFVAEGSFGFPAAL